MKFFKGCLMSVGGLVFLLVLVALFAGNANRSANGGGSGSSKASIAVNTMADVKSDRAVQIERSEIMDSIPSNNQFMKSVEAKGGKLIVVYMTLKNTGKESGNMFWSKFILTDSQERKYSEIEDFQEIVSIGAWLKVQGLEEATSQLFPGATAKTAKVFRISPDASNLKMMSNDKIFNIQ
jgi:hypothetical protein